MERKPPTPNKSENQTSTPPPIIKIEVVNESPKVPLPNKFIIPEEQIAKPPILTKEDIQNITPPSISKEGTLKDLSINPPPVSGFKEKLLIVPPKIEETGQVNFESNVSISTIRKELPFEDENIVPPTINNPIDETLISKPTVEEVNQNIVPPKESASHNEIKNIGEIKKTKNKKLLFGSIAIVLLLLIGLGIWFFVFKSNPVEQGELVVEVETSTVLNDESKEVNDENESNVIQNTVNEKSSSNSSIDHSETNSNSSCSNQVTASGIEDYLFKITTTTIDDCQKTNLTKSEYIFFTANAVIVEVDNNGTPLQTYREVQMYISRIRAKNISIKVDYNNSILEDGKYSKLSIREP